MVRDKKSPKKEGECERERQRIVSKVELTDKEKNPAINILEQYLGKDTFT